MHSRRLISAMAVHIKTNVGLHIIAACARAGGAFISDGAEISTQIT